MRMVQHAGPTGPAGRQGRLVHGYLHKTSNNLCGIKGYASLIAASGDALRTADWARKILAEVEHMETLYRSVEEIAFPRRGQLAGERLGAVVHAAAADARRRHAGLQVVTALAAAGPLLLPARDLHLILRELLDNAADAGQQRRTPTRVAITTAPGGPDRLALRLADDGPGLPPGLRPEEAVAPFVTTKPQRLGIGLARVDTLLEMYGLRWSLGDAPGGGLSVELEVAEAAEATAARAMQPRLARAAAAGRAIHE